MVSKLPDKNLKNRFKLNMKSNNPNPASSLDRSIYSFTFRKPIIIFCKQHFMSNIIATDDDVSKIACQAELIMLIPYSTFEKLT